MTKNKLNSNGKNILYCMGKNIIKHRLYETKKIK